MKQSIPPIQKRRFKFPKTFIANLRYQFVPFPSLSLFGPTRAKISAAFADVKPYMDKTKNKTTINYNYANI